MTALQKMSDEENTDPDALRVTNSTSASNRKINIVVVGNSYVGKTKLVESFTDQIYSDAYVETNVKTQSQEFSYKFQRDTHSLLNVSVNICDISGRRDSKIPLKSLDALGNPLDVVVFVFSIDDEDSHASITNYWLKHIWKYCNRGDVEFVVVATKSDLRTTAQVCLFPFNLSYPIEVFFRPKSLPMLHDSGREPVCQTNHLQRWYEHV